MIYFPILPTLLPVTSRSSHPPDSASDVRHMSTLRVLRGSKPLVTTTKVNNFELSDFFALQMSPQVSMDQAVLISTFFDLRIQVFGVMPIF